MPVVALPAFPAVLGARLKLTVLPLLMFTVKDSVRLAFRVTKPILEFLWADAKAPASSTASRPNCDADATFRYGDVPAHIRPTTLRRTGVTAGYERPRDRF